MEAAQSVLAHLGMDEHQAIVAAHTDEPHPHIHIVANTVHPATGRAVNLFQSKHRLSAWALHWEETHGGVIVETRASSGASDLGTPTAN